MKYTQVFFVARRLATTYASSTTVPVLVLSILLVVQNETNSLLTLVEYCCSKHISGNESIMRTDAGALVHARRTSAPPSETAFRL